MKKLLVTSFVLLGGLSICSTASAAILGSKHDFTATGTSTIKNTDQEGAQTCIPCHAPHNNINTTGTLLWNHDSSDETYTVYYSSPSIDFTAATPASLSKVCLSCHDGTIAIDAYAGHTSDGTLVIDSSADIGSTFGDDHPFSFLYDQDLVDDDAARGGAIGLNTPADVVTAGLPLFAGMMECGTCHDVHNKHDVDKLLNIDNSGSALCTTCHIK